MSRDRVGQPYPSGGVSFVITGTSGKPIDKLCRSYSSDHKPITPPKPHKRETTESKSSSSKFIGGTEDVIYLKRGQSLTEHNSRSKPSDVPSQKPFPVVSKYRRLLSPESKANEYLTRTPSNKSFGSKHPENSSPISLDNGRLPRPLSAGAVRIQPPYTNQSQIQEMKHRPRPPRRLDFNSDEMDHIGLIRSTSGPGHSNLDEYYGSGSDSTGYISLGSVSSPDVFSDGRSPSPEVPACLIIDVHERYPRSRKKNPDYNIKSSRAKSSDDVRKPPEFPQQNIPQARNYDNNRNGRHGEFVENNRSRKMKSEVHVHDSQGGNLPVKSYDHLQKSLPVYIRNEEGFVVLPRLRDRSESRTRSKSLTRQFFITKTTTTEEETIIAPKSGDRDVRGRKAKKEKEKPVRQTSAPPDALLERYNASTSDVIFEVINVPMVKSSAFKTKEITTEKHSKKDKKSKEKKSKKKDNKPSCAPDSDLSKDNIKNEYSLTPLTSLTVPVLSNVRYTEIISNMSVSETLQKNSESSFSQGKLEQEKSSAKQQTSSLDTLSGETTEKPTNSTVNQPSLIKELPRPIKSSLVSKYQNLQRKSSNVSSIPEVLEETTHTEKPNQVEVSSVPVLPSTKPRCATPSKGIDKTVVSDNAYKKPVLESVTHSTAIQSSTAAGDVNVTKSVVNSKADIKPSLKAFNGRSADSKVSVVTFENDSEKLRDCKSPAALGRISENIQSSKEASSRYKVNYNLSNRLNPQRPVEGLNKKHEQPKTPEKSELQNKQIKPALDESPLSLIPDLDLTGSPETPSSTDTNTDFIINQAFAHLTDDEISIGSEWLGNLDISCPIMALHNLDGPPVNQAALFSIKSGKSADELENLEEKVSVRRQIALWERFMNQDVGVKQEAHPALRHPIESITMRNKSSRRSLFNSAQNTPCKVRDSDDIKSTRSTPGKINADVNEKELMKNLAYEAQRVSCRLSPVPKMTKIFEYSPKHSTEASSSNQATHSEPSYTTNYCTEAENNAAHGEYGKSVTSREGVKESIPIGKKTGDNVRTSIFPFKEKSSESEMKQVLVVKPSIQVPLTQRDNHDNNETINQLKSLQIQIDQTENTVQMSPVGSSETSAPSSERKQLDNNNEDILPADLQLILPEKFELNSQIKEMTNVENLQQKYCSAVNANLITDLKNLSVQVIQNNPPDAGLNENSIQNTDTRESVSSNEEIIKEMHTTTQTIEIKPAHETHVIQSSKLDKNYTSTLVVPKYNPLAENLPAENILPVRGGLDIEFLGEDFGDDEVFTTADTPQTNTYSSSFVVPSTQKMDIYNIRPKVNNLEDTHIKESKNVFVSAALIVPNANNSACNTVHSQGNVDVNKESTNSLEHLLNSNASLNADPSQQRSTSIKQDIDQVLQTDLNLTEHQKITATEETHVLTKQVEYINNQDFTIDKPNTEHNPDLVNTFQPQFNCKSVTHDEIAEKETLNGTNFSAQGAFNDEGSSTDVISYTETVSLIESENMVKQNPSCKIEAEPVGDISVSMIQSGQVIPNIHNDSVTNELNELSTSESSVLKHYNQSHETDTADLVQDNASKPSFGKPKDWMVETKECSLISHHPISYNTNFRESVLENESNKCMTEELLKNKDGDETCHISEEVSEEPLTFSTKIVKKKVTFENLNRDLVHENEKQETSDDQLTIGVIDIQDSSSKNETNVQDDDQNIIQQNSLDEVTASLVEEESLIKYHVDRSKSNEFMGLKEDQTSSCTDQTLAQNLEKSVSVISTEYQDNSKDDSSLNQASRNELSINDELLSLNSSLPEELKSEMKYKMIVNSTASNEEGFTSTDVILNTHESDEKYSGAERENYVEKTFTESVEISSKSVEPDEMFAESVEISSKSVEPAEMFTGSVEISSKSVEPAEVSAQSVNMAVISEKILNPDVKLSDEISSKSYYTESGSAATDESFIGSDDITSCRITHTTEKDKDIVLHEYSEMVSIFRDMPTNVIKTLCYQDNRMQQERADATFPWRSYDSFRTSADSSVNSYDELIYRENARRYTPPYSSLDPSVRDDIIARHNNSELVRRLLSKYPSLRPGSWSWIVNSTTTSSDVIGLCADEQDGGRKPARRKKEKDEQTNVAVVADFVDSPQRLERYEAI